MLKDTFCIIITIIKKKYLKEVEKSIDHTARDLLKLL